MRFARTLLTNHPLVNILFAVVFVMGVLSFGQMPREQDPEINFNVISINTVLPGAAAADVEQLVTGPLEDALRNVQDIKFVASSSREGISDIMVRFRELSEREFDKRITDVRREVQSKANDELPADIEDPYVLEFTTSNGFPTAMVVVVGQADDERLRRQSKLIKEDLERLPGIDRVQAFGFNELETFRTSSSSRAARGKVFRTSWSAFGNYRKENSTSASPMSGVKFKARQTTSCRPTLKTPTYSSSLPQTDFRILLPRHLPIDTLIVVRGQARLQDGDALSISRE